MAPRAAAAAQCSASAPAPAASRLSAATAASGAQPAICSGVNSLSQRAIVSLRPLAMCPVAPAHRRSPAIRTSPAAIA